MLSDGHGGTERFARSSQRQPLAQLRTRSSMIARNVLGAAACSGPGVDVGQPRVSARTAQASFRPVYRGYLPLGLSRGLLGGSVRGPQSGDAIRESSQLARIRR
jgi:hypothetical protein